MNGLEGSLTARLTSHLQPQVKIYYACGLDYNSGAENT